MKITSAVDASVNWLQKLLQYKGPRECYQYFRETLGAAASGQLLNELAVLLNEHIKKNQYLC